MTLLFVGLLAFALTALLGLWSSRDQGPGATTPTEALDLEVAVQSLSCLPTDQVKTAEASFADESHTYPTTDEAFNSFLERYPLLTPSLFYVSYSADEAEQRTLAVQGETKVVITLEKFGGEWAFTGMAACDSVLLNGVPI